MHRGPKFLVPLGPVPFPIIASLAGREVGPGFPALSHYRHRLRPRGDWQERRFAAAENNYLTKLKSITAAALTLLSTRPCALCHAIWRSMSAASSCACGSMKYALA